MRSTGYNVKEYTPILFLTIPRGRGRTRVGGAAGEQLV